MKLRAKARKNCVVDTTTKSRRLAWRVAVASGMSALIPILSRRVKAPGDADRGGSLPRYYLLVQLDTVSGSGYTACFGGVDAVPGWGRLVTLPPVCQPPRVVRGGAAYALSKHRRADRQA